MKDIKLNNLKKYLKEQGEAAIAYSGGIDSLFLLKFATMTLGKERVKGYLIKHPFMGKENYKAAIKLLDKYHLPYEVIEIDTLKVPAIKSNSVMRCYHCKKAMMKAILEKMEKDGFNKLLVGENKTDTLGEVRPGKKAIEELKILTPLIDLDFYKEDIRKCARKIAISEFDMPSNSCLATRFPYDSQLMLKKLRRVEKVEVILKACGYPIVRAREENDILRLEIRRKDFSKLVKDEEVIYALNQLGYKFITLDLNGYRKGSYDK